MRRRRRLKSSVAAVTTERSGADLADFPGLADSDSRALQGRSGNFWIPNRLVAAIDALDHGLTDVPRKPGSPNAPLVNDASSLELDAGLFTGAPLRAQHSARGNGAVASVAVPREVSAWAAAAVMAFGVALGATAAIAVFHDQVAHIVASWDGPSSPNLYIK